VGYLGHPRGLEAAGWWVPGCGVLLLLLDGVDGRLARRGGMASPFGARFDMEVDAALILVLAALLYQQGRAGAWVLAAGLLRYVFVGAGVLVPWMGRTLHPKRRRQAVCVVQTATLVAALAPGLPSAWAAGLAGLGLGALVLSFAVDTVWLFRRRREG
jgi:phosphatidylglycerophosphate synthase